MLSRMDNSSIVQQYPLHNSPGLQGSPHFSSSSPGAPELFTGGHNSSPARRPANNRTQISSPADKSGSWPGPTAVVANTNNPSPGTGSVAKLSNHNNNNNNNNQSPANGSVVRWPGNEPRGANEALDNSNVRQSVKQNSPILDHEGNLNNSGPLMGQYGSSSVTGINYGTFGETSPRVSESRSSQARHPRTAENENRADTSSGEDEGTVRTYNVSGKSETNRRVVYVRMKQLTVTSESGELVPEAGDDENGNSGGGDGCGGGEEEAVSTAGESSCSGDGQTTKSSSLLVTTTVSFDENHKRNSIHMFVADVNENEHINEVEETTHV